MVKVVGIEQMCIGYTIDCFINKVCKYVEQQGNVTLQFKPVYLPNDNLRHTNHKLNI